MASGANKCACLHIRVMIYIDIKGEVATIYLINLPMLHLCTNLAKTGDKTDSQLRTVIELTLWGNVFELSLLLVTDTAMLQMQITFRLLIVMNHVHSSDNTKKLHHQTQCCSITIRFLFIFQERYA